MYLVTLHSLLFFCSYDEIRQMYATGYDYAARLHANGSFNNFDLAEVLLEVRLTSFVCCI